LKFECSAVSTTSGITTIYRIPPEKIGKEVPDWADGCTTLHPESHIEELRPHMVEQKIRTLTFKELINKHNITSTDFIQIDTEGSDYEIFLQILQLEFLPSLFKIEIAHITYTKVPWMRWMLENRGYKTFIDNYDLVAYRF
jgi:FkbM family methyltransferase